MSFVPGKRGLRDLARLDSEHSTFSAENGVEMIELYRSSPMFVLFDTQYVLDCT
jgi:hypothetical protein